MNAPMCGACRGRGGSRRVRPRGSRSPSRASSRPGWRSGTSRSTNRRPGGRTRRARPRRTPCPRGARCSVMSVNHSRFGFGPGDVAVHEAERHSRASGGHATGWGGQGNESDTSHQHDDVDLPFTIDWPVPRRSRSRTSVAATASNLSGLTAVSSQRCATTAFAIDRSSRHRRHGVDPTTHPRVDQVQQHRERERGRSMTTRRTPPRDRAARRTRQTPARPERGA